MINKIPVHVGIIPDGNRRWARNKNISETMGHEKSAEYENITSLFNEAKKLGIRYISIWGFSTENWKRSRSEIKVIFNLILRLAKKLRRDAHKFKIRFRHFGRKDRLPKDLLLELRKLEEETKNYGDFNVQFCLDYGGRDEILRAVNKILKEKKRKITEKEFLEHLDSRKTPDPDLIIRTSGEMRTSGFMPFQSTYAELAFVKKHFPDFNGRELKKVVSSFGKRNRRFGGN